MRSGRQAANGFTLVETIITSGILVALTSMTLLWFTGGVDLWWVTTTQSQLRLDAQRTFVQLGSELRNATRTSTAAPSPNIVIPAAPNNTSITFVLPIDANGDGLIIDAAGNTEWDTANPIQYAYNAGTRQIRRIVGAQAQIIANDVQSVQFIDRSIDATLPINEMRLTMTMQKTTPQQRTVTTTSTSSVRLRN